MSTLEALARFGFEVPAELEAGEPPEARGLARDEVRLMVADRTLGRLMHARFRDLPEFLEAGDLLVINTSKTIPASLPAITSDGVRLRVHLSSRLPNGRWLIELRTPAGGASKPYGEWPSDSTLVLPEGGLVRLIEPFSTRGPVDGFGRVRLWEAGVAVPGGALDYANRHGRPIRYGHSMHRWPISTYQTVYATDPGSPEMPSAGRGFTPELITRLVANGVVFAPVLLHTGVSSSESVEPPAPEWYRVPQWTARLANATRAWGRRVVAVGTTVVRALESAV